MILLAVDTATTSCSAALFRNRELLAEVVFTAGSTHSRHLMSMIQDVLQRCGCKAADVGAIAVTRGPGTFTGLRIGLSTVKGLAAATGARVIGVSSLAALALPLAGFQCPVIAMIDARRGEVYHARYRCGPEGVQRIGDAAVDAPEAVAATVPDDAVLVGSGAVLYRDLFAACPTVRLADPLQHIIRAASVGMLALTQRDGSNGEAAADLVPEYIRKSDAQIQLSGSC